MSKVIITAALNGLTTHRGECAKVPFTPEEIAAEAQRASDAGAAIVHVHAREDGGAPSYRSERYYEVIQAIRERCSALISVSTGAFGVSLEDRLAPVTARPDFATLPMGTMSYARYNKSTHKFDYDHVFANPFGDMIAVAERTQEHSVQIIASCYDMGHVASAEPLRDMGLSTAPTKARFLTFTWVLPAVYPPTHSTWRAWWVSYLKAVTFSYLQPGLTPGLRGQPQFHWAAIFELVLKMVLSCPVAMRPTAMADWYRRLMHWLRPWDRMWQKPEMFVT